MENTFFLQFEIIIFLVSFCYFIYYIFLKIATFSFSKRERKSKIKDSNIKKNTEIKEVIKETKFQVEEDTKINNEDKIRISEILRKQAILVEKEDYEWAKTLIIEWLAINKDHKQLNLELANIYNKQSDYKKSEIIYRELIEKQKNDFDLLKKLGFVLALQKKYKDSIRVYKEALEKKENDMWIIDILSDLSFEVEDYESAKKYAKKILKDKPKDVEKLQIMAYSFDNLWKLEKALNYYNKILDIQPYNETIIQRKKEIEEKLNNYEDIEKVENIKNKKS